MLHLLQFGNRRDQAKSTSKDPVYRQCETGRPRLPRAPAKGSSTPRMSPQTASLENLDRPVQPTILVEPPAQVNPKETLPDTQATEDMSQTTRPDSRGIQMFHILKAIVSHFLSLKPPCPHMIEAHCEFFPSNFAQMPAPSPPVVLTDTASLFEVYNRSANLNTTDIEDKAGSEVDKGERHEVSRIIRKHRQHICPPPRTRPVSFPS